jgi:curved DNA binding protein
MVDTEDFDNETEKTFVEEPAILDKYKAAASITDACLAKAVELCVPGADIHTVCQTIDEMIEEQCKKTYASKKAKNIEKGIAFPTCISVNQLMGHYSPLSDESSQLADGDIAKIMLGAHIDGYSANAATTMAVGTGKITGRKADAVLACWNAFQGAQRKIAAAATNREVSAVIQKIAEEFKCNAVEGALSHKVKKHLIDGNDCIINKATPGYDAAEFEFAPGDVIGLDIYVSSGEGKPREAEMRCTVFKRELDQVYNLKMKASRAFFVEVNKRFPTLPFAVRSMTDQTGAKVAIRECTNHNMLMPYPVLTETAGEFVAQFKCTIVVQPRSTAVIAGAMALDQSRFESEHSVQTEELKTLLAQPLWKKEKAKKEKK